MAINLCKFSLRAGILERKWIRLQLRLCCWGWILGSYPITKPCVGQWGCSCKVCRTGAILGIVTVAGVSACLLHNPPPGKYRFSWFGVKHVNLQTAPS